MTMNWVFDMSQELCTARVVGIEEGLHIKTTHVSRTSCDSWSIQYLSLYNVPAFENECDGFMDTNCTTRCVEYLLWKSNLNGPAIPVSSDDQAII